jgi:hypothetical protein
MKIVLVFSFLIFLIPFTGTGQIIFSGMVADSATLQPITNVNITVKNNLHGTISDDRGYFSIRAFESDTLIFSRVGYLIRICAANRIKGHPVIYLAEEQTVLPTIMIVPYIQLFGIPQIPRESPFINPTYTKAYTDTPGVPNMQSFGPSYVYKGIFSRYNKFEKERKKLPKVQAENQKAKTYMEVVGDHLIKAELMNLYSLSEAEYYRLLGIFNEKYKDSIYELQTNELISLLHSFYASNKKKK